MLYWVGIDQPMKMKETSRAMDKKPQVNNNQVIDSDYRGEIMVALYNQSNETKVITSGDRIAQIIIQPVEQFGFKVKENLSGTKRGENGFGSTGKR